MSKLTNRKSVDVNINAPKDRHVPVFDLQTRLWYTIDYRDIISGSDVSRIVSGSVTASVDPAYGFKVNANTTISGSTLITGSLEVTGSVSVTGSMLFTNNNARLSFYGDPLTLTRAGTNLKMYAAYQDFLNHSVLTSDYSLTILGNMGQYITLPSSIYNGIGINTITPQAKLDVNGSGRYTGGLTVTGSLNVSGSITTTGSLNVSQGITGSLFGTASQAITASYLLGGVSAQAFPYSGSAQITGSLGVTGSLNVSGSITTTGTLTAQTLIVQTITSSIIYSSGSNIFGNDINNTQTFTGSVNITGSLNLIGSLGIGKIPTSGIKLDISGSTLITGSLNVSNGITGSFSGSFFGNGSGLTNIQASSVNGINLFSITTGSVSASVNLGPIIFTIISASSTIFSLSNSGSLTVNATGSVPHFFLITSGSKNVFKINNEGAVENKVFEGGNVPTPQYGGIYFTSQSMYVGLD
jgi:hypothetical protein